MEHIEEKHKYQIPELSGDFIFHRLPIWHEYVFDLTYEVEEDEISLDNLYEILNKLEKDTNDAVRDIRLYRLKNGREGDEAEARIRGPCFCDRSL